MEDKLAVYEEFEELVVTRQVDCWYKRPYGRVIKPVRGQHTNRSTDTKCIENEAKRHRICQGVLHIPAPNYGESTAMDCDMTREVPLSNLSNSEIRTSVS